MELIAVAIGRTCLVACQAANKQLQRPVVAHRGDAARAPFHYARASSWTAQRAAAELRRYVTEKNQLLDIPKMV